MRIYRGKVEPTSRMVVSALLSQQLIDVSDELLPEVHKDVESVMNEYLRITREINERAKDIVERQNLDRGSVGKIRRKLALDKKVGIDEEALDYIVGQIIEVLENSQNVAEIYGELHDLNRVVAPILREQMKDDEELDLEIRKQIKHMEAAEGSVMYDVEYKRIREEVERLKKLD